MNYPLLKYRLAIGGVPWVFRTALGLAMERLRRQARSMPLPEHVGSRESGVPKIVYLHSGWAIETVGRLWFTNQTLASVHFVRANDPRLTAEFLRSFDLIWYGYSSLCRADSVLLDRTVIAVHDPAELSGERSNWKKMFRLPQEKKDLLSRARAVVAISEEMQSLLQAEDIPCLRIPTASEIPSREPQTIPTESRPCFVGVGRIYRRKNFELFREIQERAKKELRIPSYLKCDHFPLDESAYLALLDSYAVYVCTSFQEGGPLPLMDAMRRGQVPISTPVGQVPELITHGVNGFLCETIQDVLCALRALDNDRGLLHQMRLAALTSIQTARRPLVVHDAVNTALSKILNPSSVT